MRHSRSDDDEYSVVSVQPSWGTVSIAIFLFSLPIQFWSNWSPWHPRQYQNQPGKMALGIVGIAALGMLVAWLGTRYGSHRRLARWALILNATVAGLVLLIVLSLAAYWRVFL